MSKIRVGGGISITLLEDEKLQLDLIVSGRREKYMLGCRLTTR